MDARCFRIMYANVVLDFRYQVRSPTIEGPGRFITEEEFRA